MFNHAEKIPFLSFTQGLKIALITNHIYTVYWVYI